MSRLGKNINGYFGETIDILSVVDDCVATARGQGWSVEIIFEEGGIKLFALRREAAQAADAVRARRVYISAGIHGDEPAGPLSVLRLLKENRWPENTEIWLCPCLNPTGFAVNRRENAAGIDLNRDYLHFRSAEIRAHVAWLDRQPEFDLSMCLHEDWEAQGFYLYELNPEGRPSLAETMVKAVAAVCPIDLSEMIEGRAAKAGIINPSVDPASRPDWPEAFYLLNHKTRLCYTVEAASDFPLAMRVDALVAATNAALAGI